MTKSLLRASLVIALAVIVSSCSGNGKLKFCPGMTSVLDAAVMTNFKQGAALDPSNATYTVRISDVDGNCDYDKKGKNSDSSLDITFTASRPAAGDAAQFTVPYFVAVTQSDRIIEREKRSVTFSFEAGATTAQFTDHVSSVSLITDGDKKPYDYQILVGFQLTQEQLDYNRKTGIFQQ